MKKISIIILTAILGISLSSCDSKEDKFQRIDQIEPEVSYGYISVSDYALSSNFNHIYFQEAAAKILKKRTTSISYPYATFSTDKYMYFLIEYQNRDGNFINFNAPDNKHEFDIALFRVDIFGFKLEKIYDFKKVIPTGRYQYTKPNIVYVLNDHRAVFLYNGRIEVFNPSTQEVLSSRSIYEAAAYRNAIVHPYVINRYGDVIAIIKNTLHYYELVDDVFVKKQFVATGSTWTERYDDYLILSTYTDKRLYLYAYYLSTGESADLATAIAHKERYEQEQSTSSKDYDFILNDIKYTYNQDSLGFTFSEYEGDKTYTIDIDYMIEHSAAYRQIAQLWNKHEETLFAPQYFRLDAGKMFLIFFNPSFGQSRAGFIYEYDFLQNQIAYVGYHYSEGIGRIIPLFENQ